MEKIFWCTQCLNMSTRPRIEFNSDGVCNACAWAEEKKSLDWSSRQEDLEELLIWARGATNSFDCIVPVSGGKDGSYVAHSLKHRYGMNPLCITVRPPLELEIGRSNLESFINSGYTHIFISPHPGITREFCKRGFVTGGYPYLGWMVTMKTAVFHAAIALKIPLIVYGEDGEVEYGGSTETKNKPSYDVEYIKRVYFQNSYDDILQSIISSNIGSGADIDLWKFPNDSELDASGLKVIHWSYFEPWDSYRNYIVAKQQCGLKELEESNAGTFTNFAQNDQALAALHYYMMYLKFGFGRATQDAGIEIRRGAMDREQAIQLVTLFDGQFPEEMLSVYCDYFSVSESEFRDTLDKFANTKLLVKERDVWRPRFTIGEDYFL